MKHLITPQFTAIEIEPPLLAKETQSIRFKKNENIIFLDAQGKAHLAYHLSYYLMSSSLGVKSLNYIIDANSNEILQQWDNAHSENLGKGLGGNGIPMPYRSGVFQYGTAFHNLPSLGKLAV